MARTSAAQTVAEVHWLRTRLAWACWAWALVGGAIALSSMSTVNPDARTVVLLFSIAMPAAALAAGLLLILGRIWAALVLILLSIATPTYFFAIVNLAPIVISVLIVVRRARLRTPTPSSAG